MIWPATSAVLAVADPLIRRFEGFRSIPYLCPAGKPTIGFGTTKYPDGRKVALTDPPCTMAQAITWLDASATRVLLSLQAPGIITRPPTIHQAGAITVLAYNVGLGVHDGKKGDLADSTLLDRFNAGNIQGAADQFPLWNKARVHGVLQALDGLTTRRLAERALFLTPDVKAA